MQQSPPFRRLLLFAAILSLAPAVHAQDKVALQLLSFPRAQNPDPVELLVGDQKTLEVEIPTNRLSQTYSVPRSTLWVVGETVVGPDGKSSFKEFGRTRALDSPSQLLLLIRKGQEPSDGFVVMAMDNREASFGGGRFLFMNAATVDIAGEVGGAKFVIQSGNHSIVRPRSESGADSFHAMFYFRAEEAARPFFSTRWPVSEAARSLVFFYNDPKTDKIRLHTIRDFP
jgi:hypothetical protein